MSDEGAEDREHAPSQKKLDEARRRGDVPRSADFAAAFAMAGFVIALVTSGPLAMAQVGSIGAALIDSADTSGTVPWAHIEFGRLLAAIVGAAAAFFLLPAAGSVLGHLVQKSWTFTPSNLTPRLSRVSPPAILRQRFGLSGLAEFAKSGAKALLASGLLLVVLVGQLDEIVGAARLPAVAASLYLADQILGFTVMALGLSIVVGLADWLWQGLRFLARNRMSRKELADEFKESEGDPHAKSHRRQRGQDLALNQMVAEVARADVVIVNPTHFAVALKWDRGRHAAPVCLAKGVDETAHRIRAAAIDAGVPIRHDPPTARAIHAAVRIGQEVRPDHYRAVAAAIRFAEAVRRRSGKR